jgi:hypothetical protein
MWNTKLGTNDWKTIYDYQNTKYHTLNKNMKMIILNEYMQNIHLGFNKVWKYLEKWVMENHYSYTIFKYVMW